MMTMLVDYKVWSGTRTTIINDYFLNNSLILVGAFTSSFGSSIGLSDLSLALSKFGNCG